MLPNKGYGFVRGTDGRTYFIHAKDCRPRSDFDLIAEGQEVEFEPSTTNDDKLRGLNVTRCAHAG
jgi:cold shock CspA family protein